jgi:hypothetical protein
MQRGDGYMDREERGAGRKEGTDIWIQGRKAARKEHRAAKDKSKYWERDTYFD